MTPSLTDLCLSLFDSVAPDNALRAWTFAPAAVLPLVALLGLYCRGLILSARRGAEPTPLTVLGFAAGWLLLAAALVSPLCRMSAGLASAHMVQHVILVALAPPLLVLGGAGRMVRAALPRPASGRLDASDGFARELGGLAFITAVYGAAIWLWHLPAVYDAVLGGGAAHVAGYLLLIGAALLFWSAVLTSRRGGAAKAGAAGLALLVTTIHTGLLGALLALSPAPWFASARGGPLWGVTPLEDQQLAGAVMWAPMAGIYLVAALWLASALLSESDFGASEGRSA